jgi:N-acetylglucosaminyl-diphospho-decaprenol L-rhamnosyltransferase
VGPPAGAVSVVIITRDRCRELLRTLDILRTLPERPPVVVVDNGSSDGTAAAVRRAHPDVVVVASPDNRGAVGRNLGMRVAATPFVAFCDDDTWWSPGSISRAWSVLAAHPRLAVVTGHIIVEPGGEDDPICAELRDSPLPRPAGIPGYPLLSFLAGASMVRSRAFFGAGGFDNRLHLGGEEELLGTDLVDQGWLMTHVPDVVVHHQASTLRDPDHRRRRGIRNTLWFTWLRRPSGAALRRSAGLVARLPRDVVSLHALAETCAGVPWLVRNRRAVRPGTEAGLRLLERHQLDSRARRYVS